MRKEFWVQGLELREMSDEKRVLGSGFRVERDER